MIIGLTGGIGSGKSTVAKLFSLMGWKHFSSDVAAKNLYFDSEIKKKVKRLLGEKAYLNEKALNKNYINSLVFSNSELLVQLNHIIHPAVGEKFKAFCRVHANSNIIKESALLFEAGLNHKMDKIILVVAPDDLRIERVMSRDHLERDIVLKKMQHQIPQEEKIKKADLVIQNDEKSSLIEQVIDVHSKLIGVAGA